MRNLQEFPITENEICQTLKELAEQQTRVAIASGSVGDMTAIILMTAADIIASPTKCNHYSLIQAMDEDRQRLVQNNNKLCRVVQAAADCIHDDRHVGGEVSWKMGGHRRIKLADALKQVLPPITMPAEDDAEEEVQYPRNL